VKYRVHTAWTFECPNCLSGNVSVLQVGYCVDALLLKCGDCQQTHNFYGPRIPEPELEVREKCRQCKKEFHYRMSEPPMIHRLCPSCIKNAGAP
jgi:hypothetical protein